MKILGVIGSRRKNGNTSCLVQAAVSEAQKRGAEVEIIYLGDYTINDCRGCEGCRETFSCIMDDDMQKIYPRLLQADGIILGSPTYFYNVTADMKAFIDRCYCFDVFAEDDRSCWVSVNEVLGSRYAAVISVCEQHDIEDMGFTHEVMSKSLEALGYRVISSVKALGLFKPKEAQQDEKALEQSRKVGERLVRTIELKEEVENKVQNLKETYNL